MTRAASRGSSDAASSGPPAARTPSGYFQRSELPFTSLVFLLPFIVLYEAGTRYLGTDPVSHGLVAFKHLHQFFHLFGATGRYLPAMAVVGVLLSWHIARRDLWHVDLRHLAGMLLESTLLALPLIVMGLVAARYMPMAALSRPPSNLLVLAVGAGIYEELIFRLISFTCLSFLLIDVLRIGKAWGYILVVVLSSLCFAFYHYLGQEAFSVRTFAFRTVAGLYFGAVFLCRGFGITAGTHAAYDIIVVALRGTL